MLACSCCNQPLIINETYQYCAKGLFWSGEAPYKLVSQELLNEFAQAQKAYVTSLEALGKQMHQARIDALADLDKNPDKPKVLGIEHYILTATLPKGMAKSQQKETHDLGDEIDGTEAKPVPEGMYT